MCGCYVRRRPSGSHTFDGKDFLLYGAGGCRRVFSRGDRSSYDNVSSTCLDCFGGRYDTGLISMIGSGGPNPRVDDQEILAKFCAQGCHFSRRTHNPGATSVESG
jgi:hypothetical protein